MRRLSLVIVSVVLMTGCSSGSGSDQDPDSGTDGSNASTRSPGATAPSEADEPTQAVTGPRCSTVWQEGKTLPVDYLICRDGDVAGESDVIDCEDGSQLITYANEFFARSGQKIIKPVDAPIQDTPEYSAAYSACTGE